jgi:hypothetical protein
VRTFEHEVQTRVVISIDTRATMRLPDVASKLQLARWFAEAIAYIAGRSGDSVALHTLERGQVVELGTSADRRRIRHALQRVTALESTAATSTPSNGRSWSSLERALPPGSVWLVLTDLYFADEAEVMSLAARVRNAQQGSRWVVVVDFDSWPCETHRVGQGLFRLEGPGLHPTTHKTRGGGPGLHPTTHKTRGGGPGVSASELRVRLTSGLLDDVKGRIDERKRRFDRAAAAGGYERLRWTWPAEANPTATAIFREHFFGQEIVRRLVMPDGAR